MKTLAAILLCLSAVALSAHASEQNPWYVGVGIGSDSFDLHATDAEKHLPFTDANGNSISQDEYHFDNNATGFQAFGGYRFSPYIAAELEYMKFGDVRRAGNFTVPPGSVLSGELDSDTKFQARGLGLSVLGIWPVSDSIDLFGQAGLMRWRIRAPYTITLNGYPVDNEVGSDFGHNAFYGVGATWHWNDYGVRVQYQRFTFDHPFAATNDADADVLSASFVYSF